MPRAGQVMVTPAAGTAAGNLASILMRCLKQDLYLFKHTCEYALAHVFLCWLEQKHSCVLALMDVSNNLTDALNPLRTFG